jgi:hypothetical protein
MVFKSKTKKREKRNPGEMIKLSASVLGKTNSARARARELRKRMNDAMHISLDCNGEFQWNIHDLRKVL